MKNESSKCRLEHFGLIHKHGSAHLARTMMLKELCHLLDTIPDHSSSLMVYIQGIEEDNCLAKRSQRTRALTRRHLVALYALNPEIIVFRILRYFWHRDPEGRPLLACLCAFARDPLLRFSAPFVLNHAEGQVISREALEELLDKKYPGRYSKATLKSTVQNIISTWTQSGHLTGRVKKVRSRAIATPGSTAYSLFLGYLTNERGERLFNNDFSKLLDCSFERSVELAESASRKGWIVLKRVGTIIEALFPDLLNKKELEWISEQN